MSFFLIFTIALVFIITLCWVQICLAYGTTLTKRAVFGLLLILPIFSIRLHGYHFGSAYVIITTWFVTYAISLDILRIISMLPWLARLHNWLSWKRICHISAVLVVISSCVGFIQPYWLRVKQYHIYSERVPLEADGYKIALISDLHFGTLCDLPMLKNAAKAIGEAQPDVILNAGDLVDSVNTPDLTRQCKTLAAITPPDGQYGVLGNHDNYAGNEKALACFKASNTWLPGVSADKCRAFPQPWLAITGLNDDGTYSKYDNSTHIPAPDASAFNILLRHRPFTQAPKGLAGYQLMLHGHTHGGQMFPYNIYIWMTNYLSTGKFYRAEFRPDHCAVYISQGTGLWGPPIRFLVRPEITFFILHHKGNSI